MLAPSLFPEPFFFALREDALCEGKKHPFLQARGSNTLQYYVWGEGVARNTEFGEGRVQTRQKKSVFNPVISEMTAGSIALRPRGE